MTRAVIITRLKKYFDIRELVGPEVYNKFFDDSWFVLDTDTLHCLLIVREGLDRFITVNNWHYAKKGEKIFDERGFRSNISTIMAGKTAKKLLYLTAHALGKGLDFIVEGMLSDEVRTWIYEHSDLFPCKIRLENIVIKTGETITWVHLDTCYYERNPKVYLFNV